MGQGVEIESRISTSGTNREQQGAEPGQGKDGEQQGCLLEARTTNIRVAAACTKLQVPPTHKLGGGSRKKVWRLLKEYAHGCPRCAVVSKITEHG